MSNRTLEASNAFSEAENGYMTLIDTELAIVGLASMVEKHSNDTAPFGVPGFIEPVPTNVISGALPTPKSSNVRQDDGTWATKIDEVD